MSRKLLTALAAASSLFCGMAQAAATVTLLEAGATPREPLRYSFKSGASERATVDLTIQIAMSMGGQQMPMGNTPPVRMVMAMKTTDVGSDGSARMEFEVVSAEAVGAAPGDPNAAAIAQGLAGVKGTGGSYRISPQGIISGAQMKSAPGGAPMAALGDMEQTMEQMTALLPAEPVGIGARWHVVQQADTGMMKVSQTAEYTLRSRKGNSVELGVKMIDAKIDSGGMPAGTTVNGVAITGGGTITMDLARLVPTGTMDTDTKLTLSAGAGGGAGQSMDMNLKMRQVIGPAK